MSNFTVPNPPSFLLIGGDPEMAVPLPNINYLPYVPKKRCSTTKTAKGAVTQFGPNIDAGQEVKFTASSITPDEFNQLFQWYEQEQVLVFQGHWGEVFQVYFCNLSIDSVKACLFDISGTMVIACVCEPPNFSCEACVSQSEENGEPPVVFP